MTGRATDHGWRNAALPLFLTSIVVGGALLFAFA